MQTHAGILGSEGSASGTTSLVGPDVWRRRGVDEDGEDDKIGTDADISLQGINVEGTRC